VTGKGLVVVIVIVVKESITAPGMNDTMYAGPGWKWGHGLLLNTADIPGHREAGTGSWAGRFYASL
jgi:hypothetical protein